MSDEATVTDAAKPPEAKVSVSPTIRRALARFVRDYRMPTTAVLQPIGQSGVRITLVGAQGVLGDQVVADMATARAAVAGVDGIETVEEWNRELISIVHPAPGQPKRMAGWVAHTK